ncbi:MAG: hypothetical protein ABI548_17395, partial [Polyangiaceae bacterium]
QGGAGITTQVSAKAYPGSRELQVLKDLGPNAIVASICPKVSDQTNPDYGYNPAVGAIIERLKVALQGKCLPRPLQTDTVPTSPTYGQVLCKVIEAQKSGCDCKVGGRAVADASILPAMQAQLEKAGDCTRDGKDRRPACSTWCGCEITQLTGDDRAACQADRGQKPGYCYVDPSAESTASAADKPAVAALLNKCPTTEQQLLKFVNASATVKTPAQDAVAIIACLGAAVDPVGTDAGP